MSRVRWHHLYILLAGFDAIVILAGLWLHHQTIHAFRDLLHHTASLDAEHRELAAVSQAMHNCLSPVRRAAAGTDLAKARTLARNAALDLGAIKSRTRLSGDRMAKFWKTVNELSADQAGLFDLMERGATPSRTREVMDTIEDRHLQALRLLSAEQESRLANSAESHLEHGRILERQDMFERLLACSLIATLGLMIGYTRRLQMTDQQLREAKLRVEAERQERLAAIGEVCTGVAHGIQNPLAAISSSTELMIELGRMDADSRRRAEDVLAECSRLSRRVRRLLTFARLADVDRTPLEVNPVIREIAAELLPAFENQRLRMDLRLAPKSFRVSADPEEIGSILIELLSNALQHTQAGGTVVVTSRCHENHLELDVMNPGPGIAPGTAAHIFDLFFTTRAGGSGVGLSWARRIAQSINGTLELAPADDGIVCFRLRLPVACAPATSVAHSTEPISHLRGLVTVAADLR